MIASKKIVVYAGKGADHLTLIQTLTAFFKNDPTTQIEAVTEISPMNPDNVIAVFLPGGGQANYDVTVGTEGFKNIRNYVEAGGNFVSFCAGAYYASQRIEWLMGMGDAQRTKEPGLKFFNGIARGPITAFTGTSTDIHKAKAVNINYHLPHKDIQLKSLYWGGPLFIPNDLKEYSFESLAEFSDLENSPPCIIKSNIGKGLVILSAIHPEASAAQVATFLTGDYHTIEERMNIVKQLRTHETNRVSILRDLMYQVIDHHYNSRPQPPFESLLRHDP